MRAVAEALGKEAWTMNPKDLAHILSHEKPLKDSVLELFEIFSRALPLGYLTDFSGDKPTLAAIYGQNPVKSTEVKLLLRAINKLNTDVV